MLTPRRSRQTLTCVLPSYLKLHMQSVISLQATHRTSSLLPRNMNTQYFLWRQIQDIIGEADTWPTRIRKLFWTRNLEFWQLVMLSLFACVNGLPAPVFKAWIQLNEMARDIQDLNKLAIYCATESNRSMVLSLSAFHLGRNRYENLEGDVMPSSQELARTALLEQDCIYI
jgi:hypothetical protein